MGHGNDDPDSSSINAYENLMSEWINTIEKMPDGGRDVLVFNTNGTIFVAYHMPNLTLDLDEWFISLIGAPATYEVTHWVPLPEPPKEKAG